MVVGWFLGVSLNPKPYTNDAVGLEAREATQPGLHEGVLFKPDM